MHKHEIIETYASHRADLSIAAEKIKAKLHASLQASGVPVHTISHRIKTEQSVRNKISRPDKTYDTLCQLTDLIGLRVVTFFEDGVEEVARIVEESFAIDFDRSIDKRIHIDPSSFGYRSLHYVCKPIPESLDYSFEIQIRTILQHAWAEIEHDLGYKFPEAVPHAIKRRFSRVAGLLEIADAEFVELRESMKSYETRVDALHPTKTDALDAVLLRSIVDSEIVSKADQALGDVLNKPLASVIFYPDYLIRLLHAVHLYDSAEILSLMTRSAAGLPDFMRRYFEFTAETWNFEGEDFESIQRGYSLFLLAHWRALDQARLDSNPLERLTHFYAKLDYPENPSDAARVAKLFYEFFANWQSTQSI